MSKKDGFSVRSLFAVTAIVAVTAASLAVPSPWWTLSMSLLAMMVVAYGVQCSITSPASRPYWLSFFAALVVLLVIMVGVRPITRHDPFRTHVAGSAWEILHGEVPSDKDQLRETFLHFTVCIRFTLAIVLPAVAAYAMMFLSRKRNL